MNYQEATGKSIQASFNEFHRNNPAVYGHFKRLAFQAIASGKKKISAKMIINVIRWEVYIKTIDLTLFQVEGMPNTFKINDAFGSRLARLFADEHPEHADKLEFRRIRSL